ncbi:MAG: MFS transporter [Candidatus Bathyarchaeia archaeon]
MAYPRVFLLLCFMGAVSMYSISAANPIMPLYAEELGATGVLIGAVVSSFFVTRAFFEVPSGLISDRIGSRTPLIAGLLLGGLGAVGCGLAPNAYYVMVAYGLLGLGTAMFFCTVFTLVVDLMGEEMRGKSFGTYQGVATVGGLMGALTGGYIADVLSYRATLFVCGALMLSGFLLGWGSRSMRGLGTRFGASSPARRFSLAPLRSRVLVVVCAIAFLRLVSGMGIFGTVLPLYLKHHLLIEVSLIGILMASMRVGSMTGTFGGGFLSDRVGRMPLVLTGLLLSGVAFYLLSVMRTFWLLLPVMIFTGFSSSMVFTMLPILVAEATEADVRGTAMGLYRTSFDAGGIVGPILFVSILEGSPLITTSFYVGMALTLSNIPLALLLRRRGAPT